MELAGSNSLLFLQVIIVVARDRIELPTRGFSVAHIRQLATHYNNQIRNIAHLVNSAERDGSTEWPGESAGPRAAYKAELDAAQKTLNAERSDLEQLLVHIDRKRFPAGRFRVFSDRLIRDYWRCVNPMFRA
jgi:hypothetical protein